MPVHDDAFRARCNFGLFEDHVTGVVAARTDLVEPYDFRSRHHGNQQLLRRALYTGGDLRRKVMLVKEWGVCLSPIMLDESLPFTIAHLAAVPVAGADQGAVPVAGADELATAVQFSARRLHKQAVQRMYLNYQVSALCTVVEKGDCAQLHTLLSCGMELTPAVASIVVRDIIVRYGSAETSLALLRCLLDSRPALDVCYVSPIDERTVVGVAVVQQRPDMVQALLTHSPTAVNVTSAHLMLTPALCVTKSAATRGAMRGVEQFGCANVDCKEPQCNSEMNLVLYGRGADGDAKNSQGLPPRLCWHGQWAVADPLGRRMQAFLLAIQCAYSRRVHASSVLLKLIHPEVMRDHVLPYLGWGRTVSPCIKALMDKHPEFPRRPPVGWNVGPPGEDEKSDDSA